ncbi:Gfo/Idh/MocA family oxidoreductase [Actinomyces ruminis]|uniref:Gfo/Idh/MocA family protein n=1 Tax=Actinomyces ruminis TaxID=1937003 RepID=UPI0030B7F89C
MTPIHARELACCRVSCRCPQSVFAVAHAHAITSTVNEDTNYEHQHLPIGRRHRGRHGRHHARQRLAPGRHRLRPGAAQDPPGRHCRRVRTFAQDAAERYGYEKAVTDWRDIADDPNIDIVSIVVGNALHREIAEALIRAGKHVLCEKPLADTLESAKAMAEAEQATDTVTAVGFTYRRNAAIAEIAKLVHEGHLGEINHFEGRYWCDYGVDPNTPMAWRYSGPMGSGALGDVGSHLIDTAELICGPLVSVSGGAMMTSIKQRPVAKGHVTRGTALDTSAVEMADVTNDDVATFTGHFASGAVGTFSCSRVAWNMPNAMMLDVLGTKGRASWDLARCGEIKLDDVASPAGLGGARQVLVNPTFPYFARGSSMAFGGVGLTQIEQFTYQAYAFLQQSPASPRARCRRARPSPTATAKCSSPTPWPAPRPTVVPPSTSPPSTSDPGPSTRPGSPPTTTSHIQGTTRRDSYGTQLRRLHRLPVRPTPGSRPRRPQGGRPDRRRGQRRRLHPLPTLPR